MDFKLWLEFEEIDPGNWDSKNDFTNIKVMLVDGREYGINVWTFEFFKTAINEEGPEAKFIKPPDLFVPELSRECISEAIDKLLSDGVDLDLSLNPSILVQE